MDADENALHLIARKADGGLRDALSIFDQLVSFSEGKLTYEKAVEILNVLDVETFFGIADALRNGDVAHCLLKLDDILRRGFDGGTFIGGLGEHFRNLAVCKDNRTELLLDVGLDFKARYTEQAAGMSFAFILNALNLINECDEKYKTSRNTRLLVELALMKLAHLDSYLRGIEDIEELKKKFLK